MKKLLFLLVIVPFVFINGQNKEFNFNIDYANFKYDSTSNYVEFYYSFPESQIKVENKGGKFILTGVFHLQIQNKDTKEFVVNKSWKIPIQIADTARLQLQKSMVGLIGFVIPKGDYACNAIGSDFANEDVKKNIEFDLSVNPYNDSTISISDLQLASNIHQSDVKSSIFYKNSYEVIPNPVNIFGKNKPVIFYYDEVYNLDKHTDLKNLVMQTILTNSRGKVVYSNARRFLGTYAANVNVGTINVSKLPSGKYSVYLALNDSVENLSSMRKDVFIFNPDIKDTVTFASSNNAVLSSQFASLSSEECDDFFAKARYIASKNDEDQYAKLNTAKGKRGFLYKFWRKAAQDSTGNVHYDFNSYMKRVKIANERYKHIGMPGWKTDLGRVYILYGEPSNIERHPNENNRRPYVIWTYEGLEGGVQFIFGDLTGFNNYILLTSNKRGEINDPNWQDRLTPMY